MDATTSRKTYRAECGRTGSKAPEMEFPGAVVSTLVRAAFYVHAYANCDGRSRNSGLLSATVRQEIRNDWLRGRAAQHQQPFCQLRIVQQAVHPVHRKARTGK